MESSKAPSPRPEGGFARLSGAQLEKMLNRHGIRVYGKMIRTESDTYPAFVLVNKGREQVRRFFAELGILL